MKDRNGKCECASLVREIPMPDWLREKSAQDRDKIIPGDEAKMRYVIQLAGENVRHRTGGPFGAAIFDMESDRLIAAGINVVVPSNQSWAHAEMIAIAHAQNRLNHYSLKGCMLVTSSEPCAMCCGAIPWSGVEKMVYGAAKELAEAVGFDEGNKGDNWRTELEKRGVRVAGPMLEKEVVAVFDIYRQEQGIIY